MLRTPAQVQSYRRWRATIPFTDEQIAGALEVGARHEAERRVEWRELARRARAGFVGKEAVRAAMRYLVTRCAICGAKALYHVGSEGRCSAHKRVLPKWHYLLQDDRGVDAEVERDARAREQQALKFARWRAGRRRR